MPEFELDYHNWRHKKNTKYVLNARWQKAVTAFFQQADRQCAATGDTTLLYA